MQWHPIETAPRNELVLILGRYQLSLDPALIYVLGTFTDAAWKFDFPCPPELPPPQPPSRRLARSHPTTSFRSSG